MGRSGLKLIREYVYYWVSGIFIAVAIFALYQQYEANKLLADIKIEMSNKHGDTLNGEYEHYCDSEMPRD